MRDDSQDRLGALADAAAEAFEAYRDPDELKTVSLVIDDYSRGTRTLIVHIDGDGVATLTEEAETFLRERGATTEREVHSKRDARVLATVD